MVKVVSKNNGISLYFEKTNNNINCVAYETGKHTTGQDIGNYLNISRAAVSQTLKRTIKKIFYNLKRNNNVSNIKIITSMAEVFNVKNGKQYRNFFKLFPNNIKDEIYDDAIRRGYNNN